MPFAPGPIINSKHARRRSGLGLARNLARSPQHRVRADGHGQSMDEPCARLTAHRQANASMQGADALGAAGIRPGDITQTLGEGMTRAGRRRAPEPPGRHLQRHRAALPRQVAQHAGAAAMDTPRDDAAIGTGRARASRPSQDPHAIQCRQNLFDCEGIGNEAEIGRGHGSTPIGFKAAVVREPPASYKPQSAPCLRENQNSTGIDSPVMSGTTRRWRASSPH